MNNKLQTAKSVTKFVVSFSVTGVTSRFIRNMAWDDSKLHQGEAIVTSVVVGWAAGEAAEAYIDKKFDQLAAWFEENVTNRK